MRFLPYLLPDIAGFLSVLFAMMLNDFLPLWMAAALGLVLALMLVLLLLLVRRHRQLQQRYDALLTRYEKAEQQLHTLWQK